MYLLNLSLQQFLVLFGAVSAVMLALYLFDRSRRRQVVSTLRFWLSAEQPAAVARRRRIQQPWSLILQLLSLALLLLAIAQLRWGARALAPRDHVLVLDTSAWMSAHMGSRTVMDEARDRALAYVHAVPARDRIMLVRADALATPATAFDSDRTVLEEAIRHSTPGAAALNLAQALEFARQAQAQSGGRGEVVFVGSGKIADRDGGAGVRVPVRNLRVLLVKDPAQNCGLRKIAVRRSASSTDLWDVYVAVRNYGTAPRTVTLRMGFGPPNNAASPVGAQSLTLPAGTEREENFEFRTRAAGLLVAELVPHDAFPADDRAVLEIPAEPLLRVTVYSEQPELLRPFLSASPQVAAVFRRPSEYRTSGEGSLAILDRFRPAVAPAVDSIWIAPPAEGSPVPVRSRPQNVPFTRWLTDDPLGTGLHTRDIRLESTLVFEAGPEDIRIAEVADGPVVVARPGKPKIAVLGFQPALSAMRYELATPLLFANILRWMEPSIFRRWELSAGSVGTVKVALDTDVRPTAVRVLREDGSAVPFTMREHALHFFAGTAGTVRVLTGDREYVYSLTLPQMWESTWNPPAQARHGVPRFSPGDASFFELWHWLALLGAAGLVLEWFLFGRKRLRGIRTSARWAPVGRSAEEPAEAARR